MAAKIYMFNGPNLNLLGQREPDIYGHTTLADIEADCQAYAAQQGFTLSCKQSNHEGQLIDWLHDARTDASGIVINAGAFTHTSVALRDALSAFTCPIIELHISNIHAREPFRHHSYFADIATGVICGLGVQGYRLSLQAMLEFIQTSPDNS